MDEDDPYIIIRKNVMLLLGNAFHIAGGMIVTFMVATTLGGCFGSVLHYLFGIPGASIGIFVSGLFGFIVADAALFPTKDNTIRTATLRALGLHDRISNRGE